jgi:hypothetical protein
MDKKIWINRAKSFKAAQDFDVEYYLSMNSQERLETVQYLREIYYKMKKGLRDEGRKGLRRVIKIIEQA